MANHFAERVRQAIRPFSEQTFVYVKRDGAAQLHLVITSRHSA